MRRWVAQRTSVLLAHRTISATAALPTAALPSRSLSHCARLLLHGQTAPLSHDVDEDGDNDDDAPAPAASASKKKPKKTSLRASGLRSSIPGWEVVVGIEVHAQIVAQSKLFSGASTRFGAAPNAHASAVDAAFPGTLPVLNAHAVAQAVRTGLGLGGDVQPVSKFERKHYFYCDMPQGYQITQQQFPIVRGGELVIDSLLRDGSQARVRITRIQLEQDSGKNLHDLHPERTYVDLNRAGVGLMEIVSEPDLRSSEQAAAYIRKLTSLLQHLGTCRGHMEDGSLRCDVNVSVRRAGAPAGEMGERVEVKNLNSLRSLQRAIDHELARQVALAERGEPVRRETRGFDAKTGATVLMRTKEQMLDYRFAPEPDLPPLVLSRPALQRIAAQMPELPDAIAARFRSEYGLSPYDVGVLGAEQGAPAFLDALVYGPAGRQVDAQGNVVGKMLRKPKSCANWLANELFGRLKRASGNKAASASAAADVDEDAEEDGDDSLGSFSGAGSRAPTLASSPVSAETLGALIDLVDGGAISGKAGKDVLDLLLVAGEARTPAEIVAANNWAQVTDAGLLDATCALVMAKFPAEVAAAQAGNKRIFGFLSGQVLKTSKEQGKGGQLSPAAVSKRLTELIAAAPPADGNTPPPA